MQHYTNMIVYSENSEIIQLFVSKKCVVTLERIAFAVVHPSNLEYAAYPAVPDTLTVPPAQHCPDPATVQLQHVTVLRGDSDVDSQSPLYPSTTPPEQVIGMARYYTAWHDMAWHDMTQHDMSWHNKTWYDMKQHNTKWHDKKRHDTIWAVMTQDMTWHKTWCDMTPDVIWHKTAWYSMTWHDTTWHGITQHEKT